LDPTARALFVKVTASPATTDANVGESSTAGAMRADG
jgi:hypothetical protein